MYTQQRRWRSEQRRGRSAVDIVTSVVKTRCLQVSADNLVTCCQWPCHSHAETTSWYDCRPTWQTTTPTNTSDICVHRVIEQTTCSHVMPHSSICIMDLPALQTIPFLHANGVVCTGTARTACWPTAIMDGLSGLWPARLAIVGTGQNQDRQGENIMPPWHGCATLFLL